MKAKIISLPEIKRVLAGCSVDTLIASMERGFVAYSQGTAVIPPVGLLQFDNPPGDVHIKYGYIQGGDNYVVKVASSFYDNPNHGLVSSNGTMLLFNRKTGELVSILLDGGYLTDVRTALAGAVVAKYLAPSSVRAIGIVGTGTQARLQLQYLRKVISCDRVYVWGRSYKALQKYVTDMQSQNCIITPTMNIDDITNHCNYIITTTPSNKPLIMVDNVKPGTHITAVGADAPGKQELDPAILQHADLLVVDSKSQCADHGETAHAFRADFIGLDNLLELGTIIQRGIHRRNDRPTTVADLTGVAVQDIQIANEVYSASISPNSKRLPKT